jgi:hypothetical protein
MIMTTICCGNCNKHLFVENFKEREDRPGFYKWCNFCRKEQGREDNWPPIEEHGGGQIVNPLVRLILEEL